MSPKQARPPPSFLLLYTSHLQQHFIKAFYTHLLISVWARRDFFLSSILRIKAARRPSTKKQTTVFINPKERKLWRKTEEIGLIRVPFFMYIQYILEMFKAFDKVSDGRGFCVSVYSRFGAEVNWIVSKRELKRRKSLSVKVVRMENLSLLRSVPNSSRLRYSFSICACARVCKPHFAGDWNVFPRLLYASSSIHLLFWRVNFSSCSPIFKAISSGFVFSPFTNNKSVLNTE